MKLMAFTVGLIFSVVLIVWMMNIGTEPRKSLSCDYRGTDGAPDGFYGNPEPKLAESIEPHVFAKSKLPKMWIIKK